ncbi:hypothetical protein SFC88_16635 [Nocardioides sp. HM23]|uniref:hypothetical protein n=1 Tax=Nocardioides bizhenqiangii TaxID=3095076 RepID=UPI002ACA1F79|nr:hypothetical protein [Nocardioides sp. HM23]MDZ5622473.1 hypothetical protein [Nocardioides sp. HM23]
MNKLIRAAAVLAAGAALPLLHSPSAHAESVAVADPADAAASDADIRKVRVNHAARTVYTRIEVEDLDIASSQAGVTIWFDADGSRPGPEYQIGVPLFEGADWAVTRSSRWQSVGEPRSCRSDLTFLPGQDAVRVEVGRGCLGTPNNLRVSVRMTEQVSPSNVVRDWVPSRRHFLPWVVRD